MKPDHLIAVIALVGGEVSGNPDGSTITYLSGQTPPTKSQINAKLKELEAEYDSQSYARSRQAEYPSIGDQLDMQYHDQLNGTTTWKDAIAKVKADNPKENE